MKKASAASRYAAYDSPSPSPRRAAPSAAAATPGAAHGSSRALVVAGRSGRDLLGAKPQAHGNLGSVLRRLISMDKKPPSSKNQLPVPPAAAAAAAAAAKNNGGGKLPGLSRKLFQKASSTEAAAPRKTKALMEVKNSGNNANTRTLGMVLRSERELLAQTRAQEDEIAALRLQLENKDREVERLKDLCLRQREEIRTLKDAVLFPDVEPEPEPDRRLRHEISTLTDQIQCLAQEVAQVKAEKHSARSCFDEDGYFSSPRTPGFNEETAFSLVCSITPPSHSHSDTIGMLIYLFPKLHLELRPGYPLLANSNMPSVFEIAP
ncbi:Transcriptional adapter ADA2b [Zea mays]|uniref:Transcriptional adapter ADA2b n=1 Tax=Zea mays TaxID=4577 RepID=A0A1D6GH11_MAIZE|nr:Transcriptional adapter ADA2b [Zea mays]